MTSFGFRGVRILSRIPPKQYYSSSKHDAFPTNFYRHHHAGVRNINGSHHHSLASLNYYYLSCAFSTTSSSYGSSNEIYRERGREKIPCCVIQQSFFISKNRKLHCTALRTFTTTKTSPLPSASQSKTEKQNDEAYQHQNIHETTDRIYSKENQPSSSDQMTVATTTTATNDDSNTSNHATSTTAENNDIITTSPKNWVDTVLPISFRPYARLARMDKPVGTMLLLWPCFWSTALAATPPDLYLLTLFGTGAFIMRGAGCTINDMWDADFDKSVSRTKTRPLASGQLNHAQATTFLALQLAGGLGVLVSLPHTWYCFQLGVASLPFVVAYPLMKRYTNWPQLVLGMTFNWGAFMGWAATHGTLDWNVVGPLYVSGIAWTLVYDTLYAHQDKKDDAKLGLKSTALHFGEEYTKPVLYGFSALSYVGWNMAGLSAMEGDSIHPLFLLGTTTAWSHLLWQIRTADLNDSDNLATRFKSNNTVGAIVFGSIVVGNML
mmetsp:Transcript_7702/g.11003  ORF Transcript_7702/g.11003 Transcript_7702/m.11003 type:complete len:493 (-) Transcript_7702:165-1643(-)